MMFTDGSTANYYIPNYEESLDTTMITRALLDRLTKEGVFSSAHLMITGRTQENLYNYAREYEEWERNQGNSSDISAI